MTTYRYTIQPKDLNTEIALAYLSALDFYAFEEGKEGILAYTTQKVEDTKAALEDLKSQFDFEYSVEEIPYKNWNAVWESNFDEVVVSDFCGIRADFHEPVKGVKYEIVITPKMAFGTGHHETTFMMIQSMEQIDFKGKKVLDYGCGTGILAILAAYLGAKEIDAVDIEIESYKNTLEHAQLNRVNNIHAIHGTLDDISTNDYDVILANINRNVILESLKALYHKLTKGGYILFSGVLLKDESFVIKKAREVGFVFLSKMTKGDWSCFVMQR